MPDLIAISAVIGDRNYRIKIKPSDEEVVRKTIRAINEKILEFKTQFAGKDMQDYIAMVLIWNATEEIPLQLAKEEPGMSDSLDEIEKLLDKYID
jgi:hypothetical protein